MKVCRVEQMRALDRRAVEQYGIVEELLMEHAGHAAFTAMQQNRELADAHVVICCGGGNNGGDGLVVARKLHSVRAKVTVLMAGNPDKLKGAALTNADIIRRLPIPIHKIDAVEQAAPYLDQADLIVDAIFGTGLDRPVEGKYKDLIDYINTLDTPVISLDIPSGINGDTGAMLGTAIRADITITFGGPKVGNLMYPGFAHGGELYVTHISFPPEMHQSEELTIATNEPLPLPVRPRDAHKGSMGKVLFIAGSAHYYGAPYFAAMSFLKAGGGLAFLATPDGVAPQIAAQGKEIIFIPQTSTDSGSIALSNKSALLEFAETVDMVVMGPGLSLDEETRRLVCELAASLPKPLLIDGDGLTAIATRPECLTKRSQPVVLTPHPGEMARLTNLPLSDVSTQRIDLLIRCTDELTSTIVLKGAHSLIGAPDGHIFINLSGNPGMATAGSGDVLTGTIAAMYGLGYAFDDAVRMGVFVHGLAGDLAAESMGEDGLIAGDILNHLPEAMALLRDDFDRITADHYGKIYLI